MVDSRYITEIFEILNKGHFISSNSSDENIKMLYSIIDEDDNYEELYEYFSKIELFLERQDDYYYFSRSESKVNLEQKIETAFKWIDIVDFLKTYDNAFGAGLRFTPSDIDIQLDVNSDLKSKLNGLKRHVGHKNTYMEVIQKVVDLMVKDNFVELHDEMKHEYKVLSSFAYLERLVTIINIPEEIENEIPE